MNYYCVGCGVRINGMVTYSGVYGASVNDILCKDCARYEQEQIEDTNDKPELLRIYEQNRHLNKLS